MHVSSSQLNTATQTDDKTHTERTAADLAYSATCCYGLAMEPRYALRLSVCPSNDFKTHYTAR